MVVSGHHCCKASVADFNDSYIETARCCATGQELIEATVC
jgi:hypothetical protein